MLFTLNICLIKCVESVQLSHSVVSNSVTPWTAARQTPLSMGFSRQEYWRGLPCPPPGNLPQPGTEPTPPVAPAWQADSLPLSHQESAQRHHAISVTVASQEVLQLCSHTCSGSSRPFAFLYCIGSLLLGQKLSSVNTLTYYLWA